MYFNSIFRILIHSKFVKSSKKHYITSTPLTFKIITKIHLNIRYYFSFLLQIRIGFSYLLYKFAYLHINFRKTGV